MGSHSTEQVCSGRDSTSAGNPSFLSGWDLLWQSFLMREHILAVSTQGCRSRVFLSLPMMTGSRERDRHFYLIFNNILFVWWWINPPPGTLSVLFGPTFNPHKSISSFTLLWRWRTFCGHRFWEVGRNPDPYCLSFPDSALAGQSAPEPRLELLCKVAFKFFLNPVLSLYVFSQTTCF